MRGLSLGAMLLCVIVLFTAEDHKTVVKVAQYPASVGLILVHGWTTVLDPYSQEEMLVETSGAIHDFIVAPFVVVSPIWEGRLKFALDSFCVYRRLHSPGSGCIVQVIWRGASAHRKTALYALQYPGTFAVVGNRIGNERREAGNHVRALFQSEWTEHEHVRSFDNGRQLICCFELGRLVSSDGSKLQRVDDQSKRSKSGKNVCNAVRSGGKSIEQTHERRASGPPTCGLIYGVPRIGVNEDLADVDAILR